MTTPTHPDEHRPSAPGAESRVDADDLDQKSGDELDDELDDEPDEDDDDLDADDLDLANEGGQATTEYALVLLGAALVALLLIGWATSGGGAGKVGHLLDAVLDTITSKL